MTLSLFFLFVIDLTVLSDFHDLLALSHRIIYVLNWKECGRKQPWPNLGFCLGMCLERLEETMNYFVFRLVFEPGTSRLQVHWHF